MFIDWEATVLFLQQQSPAALLAVMTDHDRILFGKIKDRVILAGLLVPGRLERIIDAHPGWILYT